MSIHPSLGTKGKGKRVRSVLKRFERVKELLEKEKWKIGDSVFGLPKLKTIKLRLKKPKKAADEAKPAGAGASATAAPAAAGAPQTKEKKTEKK